MVVIPRRLMSEHVTDAKSLRAVDETTTDGVSLMKHTDPG
jgi:hypothetical protein